MSLPVCDVIRYVHDPDGFSTVALHDGRTEEVAEVECQLAFFHIHKNTCTHIIAVILSIVILYELLHSALSPGEISLLSICPVIYLSLSVLKSFFCSSPNSFFFSTKCYYKMPSFVADSGQAKKSYPFSI